MVLPQAATAAIAAGVSFLQGGLDIAMQLGTRSRNHELFREFRRLSVAAMREQSVQIRERTVQERAQIAEALSDLVTAGILARGSAAATLGDRGVSGRAVADVQMDQLHQETQGVRRLNVLQRFREDAAEAEIRNLIFSTRSRILGGAPGVTPITNPLSIALDAGTTGLQTFATLKSIQG